MDRKQFLLLVVLVIVSGFIGGMVSGRVLPVQADRKDLTLDTLTVRAIFAGEVESKSGLKIPGSQSTTYLSGGGISITDINGKNLAGLFVDVDNIGNVIIYDKNEKQRIQLGLDRKSEKPFLLLTDENGFSRAALGAESTVSQKTGTTHNHPESTLTLYDEKGTVLFQKP